MRLKKIIKSAGIAFIMLILAVFIGCAGFQDALTPCYINEEIGEYTGEEMTSFVPYTTLFDAKRLRIEMEWRHKNNQVELQRLQEDDISLVTKLDEAMILYMQDAEQLKHTIFDSSGPIGLLATTLLGGTLGATLISKPGDKKEIERLKNGKGTEVIT